MQSTLIPLAFNIKKDKNLEMKGLGCRGSLMLSWDASPLGDCLRGNLLCSCGDGLGQRGGACGPQRDGGNPRFLTAGACGCLSRPIFNITFM